MFNESNPKSIVDLHFFDTKKIPGIRLQHSTILAFSRIVDIIIVALCLWVTNQYVGHSWGNSESFMATIAALLFTVFAEAHEIYYLWNGYSTIGLAQRLLIAWCFTGVLLICSLLIFFDLGTINILGVVAWLCLTPAALISFHAGRRKLLEQLRGKSTVLRRVAIIGANELAERLTKSLDSMPWFGYRLVGIYDDRDRLREDTGDSSRSSITRTNNADLENLYMDAHEGKVDMIFITLPLRAEMRTKAIIERLSDTTVSAYIVPDVFSFNLLHSRLTCFQGIPALSIYDSPLADYGWLKRIEDLMLSLGLLALFSLPMLLIALGIKLTSKGPIFFRQTRYGMGGEKIKVWKFRSMTVMEEGAQVNQAQRHDPRITPFGGFLRRTSLDELPQLFNVVSGSMSLVGPRPHAVSHNEYYRGLIKGYMLRHKVKPGITGLAQVSGFRGETETVDKMAGRVTCDLQYISNWSLLLDFKILWRTLFKGFISEQAY